MDLDKFYIFLKPWIFDIGSFLAIDFCFTECTATPPVVPVQCPQKYIFGRDRQLMKLKDIIF